jgi:hypothetical protein
MAEPTLNPAVLGQVNGSGDALALFDDEFTAEVRHTFKTKSVFLARQRTRTIRNAKGATFSSYGRLTGQYHIPGNAVVGQNVNKAETYIPVNNLYTVPVWLANAYEAMSNLDDKNEIRMEIAYGLANPYDIDVARTLVLGARRASDLATRPGGRTGGFASSGLPTWDGSTNIYGVDARLRNANAKTDAAVLRDLISKARETLDEDDIPEDDGLTNCALKPAQYHLLLRSPGVEMNRDFGGMGSAAQAVIPQIAGINLVKTNNLPTANLVGSGGGQNVPANSPWAGTNYTFNQTTALVWHASAAGTVQLTDVTYESEYSVERQATLILGKYMFGHGILRPETIREITSWNGS